MHLVIFLGYMGMKKAVELLYSIAEYRLRVCTSVQYFVQSDCTINRIKV